MGMLIKKKVKEKLRKEKHCWHLELVVEVNSGHTLGHDEKFQASHQVNYL